MQVTLLDAPEKTPHAAAVQLSCHVTAASAAAAKMSH